MAATVAMVAAIGVLPAVAFAHGGLPISETIIFQGDTLIVPTRYWGVFLGKDGGPWRWICEEAVNKLQSRKWAMSIGGTYHVTDYAGITSSRDGGCTWISSTGELAKRSTSAVTPDPVAPKAAWATTDEGADQPWNALFSTTDEGLTWTPVLRGDEYFHGVALASDGKRLYVVGSARENAQPPRDAGGGGGGGGDGGGSHGDAGVDGGGASPNQVLLHLSSDGGKTWTSAPLVFALNGFAPTRIVPLAVDPENPEVVYLRVETDPTSVLLRATADGTLAEVMRRDGTTLNPGIGGLAFNTTQHEMFVAASDGLYRSVGGAPPVKTSTLSQSRCATLHKSALYACSWNYAPDFAAIARSDDDGQTFTKVFQYAEACGPVETCAASTPVGTICPQIWDTYAANLGASTSSCGLAGADAGPKSKLQGPGCSGCSLGAPAPPSMPLTFFALLAVAALARRPKW